MSTPHAPLEELPTAESSRLIDVAEGQLVTDKALALSGTARLDQREATS